MAIPPFGEDEYRPLLEAMENAGGELPAAKVREILAIEDKSNLSRAVQRPIELGLIHRHQRGPRTVYRLGSDPEKGAGDFMPVLYGDDGTLLLHNCPVTEDGTPRLTRAMAQRLKRLLNGDTV